MSALRELETQLASLGMPRAEFGTIDRVRASIEARLLWRATHPADSARYDELTARIEVLLAEAEAAEARVRHESALWRLLGESGIAERDVDAARRGVWGEAMEAAAEWWGRAEPLTWLVYVGAPGTGKTVASVWLLLRALEARQRAEYRRAVEVVRLSAYDEGKRELDRLKSVDLLVVDDVGREASSDYARALLFDLLDTRHAYRLRTVLASNLLDGALSRHLGAALTDRILGDGRAVRLKGKSMRRAW